MLHVTLASWLTEAGSDPTHDVEEQKNINEENTSESCHMERSHASC